MARAWRLPHRSAGARRGIPDAARPVGVGQDHAAADDLRPDAAQQRHALLDGVDATQMPPGKRGIGMVFQNYALFPHMTVWENVAYGLRMRRAPADALKRAVAAALTMVKMDEYAHRYPRELSGGQQQRIALARCFVYRPSVILLDEPLGALDKKLREHMQLEIRHLHAELQATFIYVTHDQDEALAMSDRICLMNQARIEQIGTPSDLYDRPRPASPPASSAIPTCSTAMSKPRKARAPVPCRRPLARAGRRRSRRALCGTARPGCWCGPGGRAAARPACSMAASRKWCSWAPRSAPSSRWTRTGASACVAQRGAARGRGGGRALGHGARDAAAAMRSAMKTDRPRPAACCRQGYARGAPGCRPLPAVLFLAMFFLVPVAEILRGGFVSADGALTAAQLNRIAASPVYAKVLWSTFWISGLTALICVVAGYPVAYLLAQLGGRARDRWLLWIMLPFWTSYLVKTYAWMLLLSQSGLDAGARARSAGRRCQHRAVAGGRADRHGACLAAPGGDDDAADHAGHSAVAGTGRRNVGRGAGHALLHGLPAAVGARHRGGRAVGIHHDTGLFHRARAAGIAARDDGGAAGHRIRAGAVRPAAGGRSVGPVAAVLDRGVLRVRPAGGPEFAGRRGAAPPGRVRTHDGPADRAGPAGRSAGADGLADARRGR